MDAQNVTEKKLQLIDDIVFKYARLVTEGLSYPQKIAAILSTMEIMDQIIEVNHATRNRRDNNQDQ
jgi:hypothetical protein